MEDMSKDLSFFIIQLSENIEESKEGKRTEGMIATKCLSETFKPPSLTRKAIVRGTTKFDIEAFSKLAHLDPNYLSYKAKMDHLES